MDALNNGESQRPVAHLRYFLVAGHHLVGKTRLRVGAVRKQDKGCPTPIMDAIPEGSLILPKAYSESTKQWIGLLAIVEDPTWPLVLNKDRLVDSMQHKGLMECLRSGR